jgi:transcriptional regulator with XRE-family HTH domain
MYNKLHIVSNKLDKKFNIGQKIWQLAQSKGFTKTSFVAEMKITRSTLYSWIDGRTAPDYYELVRVSKILDIQLLIQEENAQEVFRKSIAHEAITTDMWDMVKRNNEKWEKECERLWNLIGRLELPGDGIQRIKTDH